MISAAVVYAEHVWSVKVRAKDLGARFEGDHRLCLNDRTVTLVRKTCFDPSIVFPVSFMSACFLCMHTWSKFSAFG